MCAGVHLARLSWAYLLPMNILYEEASLRMVCLASVLLGDVYPGVLGVKAAGAALQDTADDLLGC
jgi:hypothetical protein